MSSCPFIDSSVREANLLIQELSQISTSPVEGTVIRLPNEDDIFKWEVKLVGPEDSVYAVQITSSHQSPNHSDLLIIQGGKFTLDISLPKEYPFKPPVISFKTKIYHPNVSNDDKGSMCLGILRSDSWKPPNRIRDVLALVRAILSTPQPDDAVEASIADQFKSNPKEFEMTARDWVVKYASK